MMQNICPHLMMKMLEVQETKKYYFQISAVCTGVCVYMHTTFLVVEIADRFLGPALKGYNILSPIKKHRSEFFLSTFEGNVDLLQF